MKKNSVAVRRRFTWMCVLLLLAWVPVLAAYSLKKQFDPDEFEAAHTAWKVFTGERLYTEAFQHHHPFYYYLLTPVLAIFGESVASVLAMRFISFVMLGLMVVVTYRLSLDIHGSRRKAVLSALLLSAAPLFVGSAIEIRPDVPQTLFGLISIWMLLAWVEKRKLPLLILSAACLAVSFLFLQKSVFLIALLGLLLLINVWKKRVGLRDVFLYGIVGLGLIAPYFIYLICSGTAGAYWTFNWLLNMKFVQHFSAVNSVGYAFRTSTLLCVFYVWGLLKFTKTDSQIRLGWLSVGLIACTFLVRAPYRQYFMIIVPLMATIAANAIITVFEKKPHWVVVVLILSVVPGQFFLMKKLTETNAVQLHRIEYVLSVTEADDYVHDGVPYFNIFRKDLDYFWFSVKPGRAMDTYRTFADYEYNIVELLEEFKPKVIPRRTINALEAPAISDRYRQSNVHPDLYIRIDGM